MKIGPASVNLIIKAQLISITKWKKGMHEKRASSNTMKIYMMGISNTKTILFQSIFHHLLVVLKVTSYLDRVANGWSRIVNVNTLSPKHYSLNQNQSIKSMANSLT